MSLRSPKREEAAILVDRFDAYRLGVVAGRNDELFPDEEPSAYSIIKRIIASSFLKLRFLDDFERGSEDGRKEANAVVAFRRKSRSDPNN